MISYLLTPPDQAATAAKGGQAHPSSAALGEANAVLDTTAVALDTATVATSTAATAATIKSSQSSQKSDPLDALQEIHALRFEMNARARILNHDDNPMRLLTFEETTMKILNDIDQFSQSVADKARELVSPGQFQQLVQDIEEGGANIGEILSDCWNGVSDLVSDCGPVVLDGCSDCCAAIAKGCCEAGEEVLCLPFKLLECFGEILTCGGGACFD